MLTFTRSTLSLSPPWRLLLYLPVSVLFGLGYVFYGTFSLEVERPYIYRQFVPILAGILRWLSGMTVEWWTVTLLLLCTFGFMIACDVLYSAFFPARSSASHFAIITTATLMLIISYPKHTYDVPTAMFFALTLLLLARGQWIAYILLFPFICLNRETAILLTLLCAVYFFRRLERRAYLGLLAVQVLVYVGIRLGLMWIFADVPGLPIVIRPAENWQMYAADKPATILFLLATGLVVHLVWTRWERAPELARTAFLIFAPLLGILYVVSGVTFEVRVFAELVPVVMVIAVS